MTLVKLCGLMCEEDAEAANIAHPDMAGVILSSGFRRSITVETTKRIRKTLCSEIPLCGVFVDADISEINPFLEDGVIDMVQLHGKEDNSFIDQLRLDNPGVSIIKAFIIRSVQDIETANASHADLILLDGGTGEGTGFDRRLLSGIQRPYILAGGLNPGNVAEAVRALHPYGTDTSSGIEADRKKDPEKMKAFVQAVRAEDSRI